MTPFEALAHESLFPDLKKVEILKKARLINRQSMQISNKEDVKCTWEHSEELRLRTNSTQGHFTFKCSLTQKTPPQPE